ncbi:MAG: hypothetical protein ACREDZ_08685 [Kiloniellales bacterium]
MRSRIFGQLFKPAKNQDDVKVGSVYRKVCPGNVVETAKVIGVRQDSLGIPHVHYSLVIERSQIESLEETRTLGLTSFTEQFCSALMPA